MNTGLTWGCPQTRRTARRSLSPWELMSSSCRIKNTSTRRIRLTEEIRVSAEEYADKPAAVQMPVGAVSFTNSSSKFKAVPVPSNGGVYYFNNNAVLFYDVVNNSVTTLASFDKVVDVFC